jgi:Amt family ammonium transporter
MLEPLSRAGLAATAVVVTVVWRVVGAWIALRIVDAAVGLRVSPEQEREGLDVALHGEAMGL